ncbi:hypothetical protein ACRALDRAFT_206683 [Sodiomyces alcalophilus JCM 7366]|uniref:uncharacterized protein n=1 Tax=Sodiomyces alcalophilus JCM 7366 TaxID=591952 RepID=UPI0039B57E4C
MEYLSHLEVTRTTTARLWHETDQSESPTRGGAMAFNGFWWHRHDSMRIHVGGHSAASGQILWVGRNLQMLESDALPLRHGSFLNCMHFFSG